MKLDFQKLYKVEGYMFTDFVFPFLLISIRKYIKGFWIAFIIVAGKKWNIGFRVYFDLNNGK